MKLRAIALFGLLLIGKAAHGGGFCETNLSSYENADFRAEVVDKLVLDRRLLFDNAFDLAMIKAAADKKLQPGRILQMHPLSSRRIVAEQIAKITANGSREQLNYLANSIWDNLSKMLTLDGIGDVGPKIRRETELMKDLEMTADELTSAKLQLIAINENPKIREAVTSLIAKVLPAYAQNILEVSRAHYLYLGYFKAVAKHKREFLNGLRQGTLPGMGAELSPTTLALPVTQNLLEVSVAVEPYEPRLLADPGETPTTSTYQQRFTETSGAFIKQKTEFSQQKVLKNLSSMIISGRSREEILSYLKNSIDFSVKIAANIIKIESDLEHLRVATEKYETKISDQQIVEAGGINMTSLEVETFRIRGLRTTLGEWQPTAKLFNVQISNLIEILIQTERDLARSGDTREAKETIDKLGKQIEALQGNSPLLQLTNGQH